VEGFSLGKEYLLFKTEMMVGRLDREGNIFPDIDLEDQDDGYVSRQHAILRHEKGQVTVEDLGTENGTTVDNRPIADLLLTLAQAMGTNATSFSGLSTGPIGDLLS